MNGRFASFLNFAAGALSIGLAAGGCSSLQPQAPSRTFALDGKWTRSTTQNEFLGFRRMNRMAPLVLADRVIQANSVDGIAAYDRKSGSLAWRMNLVNGVEGGAEAIGDKLYFGASDGNFYCVSVATGKTFWTFPVRAETLAPPTIDGGVVYFQSGADVVYGLDAETGKQLWLYNRQVTTNLSIRATTRPVVAGDLLIAGFADGYVVALRKRDGILSWERKLGRGNRFRDVDSTPVIDGANMYVASYDAALYSLRVDTGAVNWTVDEGAYVPVTVGRDRLYYATVNGKILMVDKSAGKTLSVINVKRGIATQPVLFKGYMVYGESEGAFVVADANSGAEVSRFYPGQGLIARPTVIEGTGEAFFMSNDANLYAMQLGLRQRADNWPWRALGTN